MRQRHGYRELETEEPQSIPAAELVAEHVGAVDVEEPEVVVQEGWGALIWSFGASGAMTVRFYSTRNLSKFLKLVQLAAYFFPVVFSIPLFGNYLASEWLWTFTPSLSYIGQGRLSDCLLAFF